MRRVPIAILSLIVVIALAVAGCSNVSPPAPVNAGNPAAGGGSLTLYSGRTEKLVSPLIERFKAETGIDVKVRYGDTAELAAAILEEGKNTPADVYFAQDAGGLGALATAGRLAKLPAAVLERVDARYRSPNGEWVGVSGRARTVVYNTQSLTPNDLPASVEGFADPKWNGKIGWAPTNGSFQSFVTALRLTAGEEAARRWLEGVKANNPKVYKNNTAIVQAVGAGEIQVGFVNHYYLYGFLKELGDAFPARNYHPSAGDPGAMVNVAGAGILAEAKNRAAAEKFVAYLLANGAQQYFSDETFEYPLVAGAKAHPSLMPLAQIKAPPIDLGSLADLEATLKLLRDVGVL